MKPTLLNPATSGATDLYEFMPAALSVQATPPNPLARWLAYGLIALIFLALAWAYIGNVNIVVSADGKILPTQRVQFIQPFEKGTVSKIYVRNGDRVSKGQALVELDRASAEADLNRITNDQHALERSLRVRERFYGRVVNFTLTQVAEAKQLPTAIAVEYPNDPGTQFDAQLLEGYWREFRATVNELDSAVARIHAEQQMNRITLKSLQDSLPLEQQRYNSIKALFETGGTTQIEMLNAQQALLSATYSLELEQERSQQLSASKTEAEQKIETLTAQVRSGRLDEIVELQRQLSSLLEEKHKVEQRLSYFTLYSPVDGVVQQININTLGGVVTDAELLMSVIPEGKAVEVEVFIDNTDIGFVEEGMAAEVKIHTLPFTKYGVVDAEILSISHDAIIDEERGLVFSMLLRLDRSSLLADARAVEFKPGMAVTAEIQTGERRLIEFFLSPLMRTRMESLRER
jgi:hemolysin D